MQKISKIFLIKNILILCLLAACAEAASNWEEKLYGSQQYDTSDNFVAKGDISQRVSETNHDGGSLFFGHRQLDHSNIFWAKMLSPTHVMTIYLQNRGTKKSGSGWKTNDPNKHSLIVHHWKINLDDDKEKFSVVSWFSMDSDLLRREPVWGNRNTLSCVKSRCGQVLTFLPQEMHIKEGKVRDFEFYEPIHKNPGDAAIFIFTSDVGTKDYKVSDTLNKDDFGYQKDKTTPHRDLFKPTSNYTGKGWMRSASIVAMSGLGMATDHMTKDKRDSASFFVTFNEWIAPVDETLDYFKNTLDDLKVLPMDRWSILIQEKEYDSEMNSGFGYTKATIKFNNAFFKVDNEGDYYVTYDWKKHVRYSTFGRPDAALMMNHEHVFTVNNPEVHKDRFYMTFVMMASESKDNKFVLAPKGKHYLVIQEAIFRYNTRTGLEMITGDLNFTNQVYPFFDKEGTTLNPRRGFKIPYHPSYRVEMRQKGEALILEDGLFHFWFTTEGYFRYVNVHNIKSDNPDNGFEEIEINHKKDPETSHGKLNSIRQCGESRWVATRYITGFKTQYELHQNWADIKEGSSILSKRQSYNNAHYPVICGPNIWINFHTGFTYFQQNYQVAVREHFYYDENYVDTTSLTPAGVCDAYIEKIRTGKKACQQINHKGELYSGSAHIYYMNENKFKIDIFQQTQEQLSAAFQHMRKKNDWTCSERNDVMCKTIRLHDDAHDSTGTSKAIKDAEFFATVTWDITQRAGGSYQMDWQKKVEGWRYHGKIGILMCLMTDLDQFAPDVNFKFDKRTGREKHHFSHRTYYAMLPEAEAYMTLPDKSNLHSSTFKNDKSTSSCKPPKIPFYWFYGIDCKYTPPPPVEVATMTLPPCGLAYKVAMGFEKLNSGAFETTALNERTLLDEGQSTKSKAGELEKCFMSIKGKFTHTIKCFLHKFNATWNDKYKKTDKGEDTTELNPNYNPQFLEDGSENPKYWKGFPGFLKDEFQTAAADNGFVMWEGSDDKHKAAVEAKMGTELYEKMKADIDKFAKETKWADGFSQQLVNKSKDLVAKQDEETKVETA